MNVRRWPLALIMLVTGLAFVPASPAHSCPGGHWDYTVNAYDLTVRDAPGGRVIATVYRGRILSGYQQEGSWLYVTDHQYAPRGWVMRQYVNQGAYHYGCGP